MRNCILGLSPEVEAACDKYNAAEYGSVCLLMKGGKYFAILENSKAGDALLARMTEDGWDHAHITELGPV